MMNKVIYLINEVEGVTNNLKSTTEYNVVRDHRGDGKSFIAASLSQPDVPAVIIVKDHRYTWAEIEPQGGGHSFWVKSSSTINIITNLAKRITSEITVINYKTECAEFKIPKHIGEEERIKFENLKYLHDSQLPTTPTKITINPVTDDIYKKIDKLCGIEKDVVKKFGYKDRNGHIIDEYQAHSKFTKETQPAEEKSLTYKDFYAVGVNPNQVFGKDTNIFKKLLRKYVKYADVYGLDKTNPVDMLTFVYLQKNKELAAEYIDGSKFICPHCGSLVYVNGDRQYINDWYVSTGKTICNCCEHEFDVHDKEDVLNLAYQK